MTWFKRRPRSTAVTDLTHLIQAADRPETQTGKITVQRAGDFVTLILDDVQFARTAWTHVLAIPSGLPAGFRPTSDLKTVVASGTGDSAPWEQNSMIVRANSNLSIRTKAGVLHRAVITYRTTEGMPS